MNDSNRQCFNCGHYEKMGGGYPGLCIHGNPPYNPVSFPWKQVCRWWIRKDDGRIKRNKYPEKPRLKQPLK